MHPILLLLILAALWLLVRWLKGQPVTVRKSAGLKIGLTVLGVLALLGVLTGRLNPATLLVTAVAAVPLLTRALDLKQLFDRARSAGGPSQGQRSTVRTRFIEMHLDHDSGEMTGTVTDGRFEGRAVETLNSAELIELLDECAADPQSARLLETYLDRTYGESWRGAGNGRSRGDRGDRVAAMDATEAREILGVSENATREEVISAHRSLMQKLHPDRGGSTYLASKVNQAKDVLLSSV